MERSTGKLWTEDPETFAKALGATTQTMRHFGASEGLSETKYNECLDSGGNAATEMFLKIKIAAAGTAKQKKPKRGAKK